MRCLPSILAHVLASTAILACGGATAEVPGAEQRNETSPSGTATSPTDPPPPPLPPPSTDAGTVDTGSDDAGCTAPPVLVGQRGCADVWHQVCGIPKDVNTEDGLSQEECNKLCGPAPAKPDTYWGCGVYPLADLPGPSIQCYTCVAGRRPDGWADPPLVPGVAGWLAHAAELERVSIDAFQVLRRELAHHGAPSDLIARAELAEADEVRHTRVLAALARRGGATLSDIAVEHGSVRALVDIALENAVEGCIRETYGAIVAGWQADHAARIDVRRAMKPIYRDETAHAALAWDVHAWLMGRLAPEDRARVELAMADAVAALAASAKLPPASELVDELGLPTAEHACELVEGLVEHLWSHGTTLAA